MASFKLSPAAAASPSWASCMRSDQCALMPSFKLPPAAAAPWASSISSQRAPGASQVSLFKRAGVIQATNAATAIRESEEISERKEDHALRLLSTRASPYGIPVMVALHEKELEFEFVEEVLRSFSSELMVANPIHKKVPVLLHNGKAVCESRIIVEYIDEQWPATSSSSRGNFLPSSPSARAQARFWSDFVYNKVLIDGHENIVTNGEKQQLAIEKTIQNLYRIDRDALKMQTPECLASIKKRGPFFNNENTIGFFDITFAGVLQWLRAYEYVSPFKIPNAQKCPRLHAWIEAISEEASVQKSIPDLEFLIKRVRASRCRREFDDWNTLYKS